jgi:hypothetical protein
MRYETPVVVELGKTEDVVLGVNGAPAESTILPSQP